MALAAVVLVIFVVLLAIGSDNEADSSLATIKSSYDPSHAVAAWSGYAAMALCAVLVFFGGAVRAALRCRPTSWTADVALSASR